MRTSRGQISGILLQDNYNWKLIKQCQAIRLTRQVPSCLLSTGGCWESVELNSFSAEDKAGGESRQDRRHRRRVEMWDQGWDLDLPLTPTYGPCQTFPQLNKIIIIFCQSWTGGENLNFTCQHSVSGGILKEVNKARKSQDATAKIVVIPISRRF